MRQIKFGVGIYGTENAREAVELARRAEELGFGHFWIGDSHMIWRELYVLAGAIAMATIQIHIVPVSPRRLGDSDGSDLVYFRIFSSAVAREQSWMRAVATMIWSAGSL